MLYELNHREGLTIVVSTPYMDEAELCTRKMFISYGKILDVGTTDELLSRYGSKLLEIDIDDRRAKRWIMKCDHEEDANLFDSATNVVYAPPRPVGHKKGAAAQISRAGVV